MHPSKRFSSAEKEQIIEAIRQAEKNTSGEIRVHIENHCSKAALDRAAQLFAELKMHKTALRNGVLLYLAIEDRQFAILGDVGINSKVPNNFWDTTKELILEQFRQGEVCKGLCQGIQEVGRQLKSYFPYQSDDVNELPDEISFKD